MSTYKLHSNVQRMPSSKLALLMMSLFLLMAFNNQCDPQTYLNAAGIKDIYEIGMIHVGSSAVNSIGELSGDGTLLATTIDGSGYIVDLRNGTVRNFTIGSSRENQGYSYIIDSPHDQPLLLVRPSSGVTVIKKELKFGTVDATNSFQLPAPIVFSQRYLLVKDMEPKVARFDSKSGGFTPLYGEVNGHVSVGDYGEMKKYFAFTYFNESDVIVYDISSDKVIRTISESENLTAKKSPMSSVRDLLVRNLPWLSTYISNTILFVSFCYYDRYIIIGSNTGKISVYSTLTWQKVFEAQAHLNSPFPVALSDDLPLVGFVDQDGRVSLVDLVTKGEAHIEVSELSHSSLQSKISTLFLTSDGKYIVAGGVDGNIYAYQLKYEPPRIVLYEGGSVHLGNEVHIKVLGDMFQLKGFVQSFLPLKSITVGSTQVNFSQVPDSCSDLSAFLSGSPYPRVYSFSETLSVYKTQYFISPPMVDRSMESVLHVVDADDNMSTMSVKFERFAVPPTILITDPPLNSEKGKITVKADSGTFKISGFVFSNYPLEFVNVNGKNVKFKSTSQSNYHVNINNQPGYVFSDTVLVQDDTSSNITVVATDNQGNSSTISFPYLLVNVSKKLPPEIKITRVSMNPNSDSEQVLEIDGLVNAYNPISELTVNGGKRVSLSTRQAYWPYFYSAYFTAYLPVGEIEVDSTMYGPGLVKFVASDVSGESDTKEIYISESLPYTIDRKRFQPISVPGLLILSAGTSTFSLKSLDYPTPSLDAKRVADAIERFYNVSTSTNGLLIGDDLTSEKLASSLKTISQNALNNDFIVFFFSGYAVTSHNKTYLLTKDSQIQDLEKTALSTDELVSSLKAASQARGFLLLFDINPNTTSLTKFFGKEYPVHYTGSVKSLMEIAQQLQNSVVVLGVSENEKGEVGKQFGQHGLFTYALLNALSGEADNNGNGLIELGELIQTLKDEVNLLSKGHQHVSVSGLSERDNIVPIFSMRKEVLNTDEGVPK